MILVKSLSNQLEYKINLIILYNHAIVDTHIHFRRRKRKERKKPLISFILEEDKKKQRKREKKERTRKQERRIEEKDVWYNYFSSVRLHGRYHNGATSHNTVIISQLSRYANQSYNLNQFVEWYLRIWVLLYMMRTTNSIYLIICPGHIKMCLKKATIVLLSAVLVFFYK